MLTETIGLSGAFADRAPLPSAEASQLEALRGVLPEGWIMELRHEAGMAWTAFIYCDEAPRSSPMFTVCHLGDRVGWFAQWMNGVASSATTFTDLWPILELIQSSIFETTQAQLATVAAEDWSNRQH